MALKRREPRTKSRRQKSSSDEPLFQILYVEDDDSNWLVLEAALRGDYLLKRAATSEEALEALEDHAFDLILMDIFLKGSALNGFELTQYLKKTHDAAELFASLPAMERAIDTPIIFVTANHSDFGKGDFKQAGALDVVGKPVNMAALHRSMKKSLQEREKEAEQERQRRAEAEQDLHEATMTKFFLIGDMAHRVNNPLNVALGGVGVTQSAVGDFVKMVLGFFSEPEDRSPEEEQVIEKIDMLVSQIDTALKNTERAIGRATDYIVDLRVLGGVDGESPEEVGLKGALLKALIRLENDLGWATLERLRGCDAIGEMTVMGQTATLSVVIATWLKHVLLRSKDEDSVPIHAELTESGDHLWLWARREEGRVFKAHYVEDLSGRDLVMGLLGRHAIGIRIAASTQGWDSKPQ